MEKGKLAQYTKDILGKAESRKKLLVGAGILATTVIAFKTGLIKTRLSLNEDRTATGENWQISTNKHWQIDTTEKPIVKFKTRWEAKLVDTEEIISEQGEFNGFEVKDVRAHEEGEVFGGRKRAEMRAGKALEKLVKENNR